MTSLVPLAVLVLAVPASAAPVPKAPAKNYFPLQVGHKWEYVNPDGSESHTEEVTAEEKQDGAVFYTVTRSRKQGLSDTVFKVDKDGVARVRQGPIEYDPPMLAVKPALAVGDRWTAKLRISGREAEYELEVGKPQELKVPAFTAVPVIQTNANRLTKSTTYWYAPDVGLVKSEVSPLFVTELKAFTPAKEKK
jgi:hypothetical protein